MALESMPHQMHLEKISMSTIPKPTRKKFAKPPVKVACLACRASRVRCDGKEICSGCASRGKECCYLPSKRGGPRKKRVAPSTGPSLEHRDKPWVSAIPNPRLDEAVFDQFDSLAVPGAGLRHLDFPIDVQSMFEDLFAPITTESSAALPPQAVPPTPIPIQEHPRVRMYGSEQDILNGYYTFIHHYYPIFPPPHAHIALDKPLDVLCKHSDLTSAELPLPYVPTSPVSLAISAVLALVPHPKDRISSSAESFLLRRSYAQRFARAALESAEEDSELAESSANPSQALQNESTTPNRSPLHPHTPVELEAILATLILSVYEYAQRGNLNRMCNRAGQAYMMAMNMSLHAMAHDESIFAEARRRAWWMTYYAVCQGSIVSTKRPTIIPNDPRFTTPYPRFASDPDGWSILIHAQQGLLSATQYIIDLNQTLKSRGNMQHICERMKKLDTWIRAILAKMDTPPHLELADSQHDLEAITAYSIRSISRIKLSSARIKIHRFRAFLDIPIFIKKHCDLTSAAIVTGSSANSPNTDELSKTPCSCNSLYRLPADTQVKDSPSSTTSETSAGSLFSWVGEDSFPFTNYESTKICLDSSLTISQMFNTLPYPQPLYNEGDMISHTQLPSDPETMLPRTMPSFACCAMQSSYAMLMLYYKSRVIEPPKDNEDNPLRNTEQLAEILLEGLQRVISAVRNYSAAFEALDGMRDEIEGAFFTAFPQP
ncbi:hypothetical protein AJ80_03965 [Polytolypa hystricis UAMH7299]|uniref:Zn(2)-C6 fungal-type domain-containing protein n=1 Tax=Polytolypa hystricis (strain UAMH7299) TaxID=1447883 RepID=A0A2B7Y5N2_POLH7|nr:hypothetical protein AJ80_03965 [Polytolypa hystricis UAMH7299]